MDQLELIVFNVDHGLSVALIEKPENYLTLIDLGSRADFSPISFLTNRFGLKADILYITHPHGDHLSDINSARKEANYPTGIYYQSYDWDDVKKREKAERKALIDSYKRMIDSLGKKEYGGNAELKHWYYTPEKAKEIFGESKYINNSSLFLIYKWKDFKIAIPGDLETDALKGYLNCKGFVDYAKNSYLLIAPHHGHKEGFCSQWSEIIGKPYLTLISVQKRDDNLEKAYQSENFAKGFMINGVKRYTLTTRSDGNIKVTMHYNKENKPVWSFNMF